MLTSASLGGGPENENSTGASGPNLRGLGPAATLTLLNGSRLSYDGMFQATDVSVIPVAAIARVEVLLDGASAIYGSDAIGGVTNIILKRDYRGAEVSARFGAATRGGFDQRQYSALTGYSWDTGGFLVTGEISNNSPVRASQRRFTSQLAVPRTTLYPELDQKSALFSGHQRIEGLGTLTLDARYAQRSNDYQLWASAAFPGTAHTDTSNWGVTSALQIELPGEWEVRPHGMINETQTQSVLNYFSATTGATAFSSADTYKNTAQGIGLEADGPLFDMPAGQAKISIGGGWRQNTLRHAVITGVPRGEARSVYGYGEINLPLISEENGIPFARSVSLNGALRYEKYNTFGDNTSPKIGVLWSVTPEFDVKASWGQSFRTPTLLQQFERQVIQLLPASLLGGARAGAAVDAQVIFLGGGNPDIGPETAETFTVGFVARPSFAPGLHIELNAFQIDYADRVLRPVTRPSDALVDAAYAAIVARNPTTAELSEAFATVGVPYGTFTVSGVSGPFDPAKLFAIVDNRNRNLAADFMRGIDLSTRYQTDAFGGVLSLTGGGTWITKATRQITSTAPELASAGVVFFPAKFKGRLGASWSNDGLSLSSTLNHIAGVRDTSASAKPKRGSMTTVDLVLDYQTALGLAGDVGINLAVTNVFDKSPPFMTPANAFDVSYDSTNYSPLGRVVSATIFKRF